MTGEELGYWFGFPRRRGQRTSSRLQDMPVLWSLLRWIGMRLPSHGALAWSGTGESVSSCQALTFGALQRATMGHSARCIVACSQRNAAIATRGKFGDSVPFNLHEHLQALMQARVSLCSNILICLSRQLYIPPVLPIVASRLIEYGYQSEVLPSCGFCWRVDERNRVLAVWHIFTGWLCFL